MGREKLMCWHKGHIHPRGGTSGEFFPVSMIGYVYTMGWGGVGGGGITRGGMG